MIYSKVCFAKLWDLSLSANSILLYNENITMGDRATLGSDPSTIVMLYSIASALSVGDFNYRQQ